MKRTEKRMPGRDSAVLERSHLQHLILNVGDRDLTAHPLHTIEVPTAALPGGPRFSVTNCAQANSKHHKSIGLSRASLDYRNRQHDGSGSSYIHFIM